MHRDFDATIARYFAGDLDAVERRAFERALAVPGLRRRFDAIWDRRIAADGIRVLRCVDSDLRDCFSHATLSAYAVDRLALADAVLIDAHMSCPLCRDQVAMLRQAGPAKARVTRRRRRWWGWVPTVG